MHTHKFFQDFHLQSYPVLQDQVYDKIKFHTVDSLRNVITLLCIAWDVGYNNPVPVIKISNYTFEYVVSGKVMQHKLI